MPSKSKPASEPKFIRCSNQQKMEQKILFSIDTRLMDYGTICDKFVSSDGRPAETLEQYKSQLSQSRNKREPGGKRAEPNSIFYQFNDEGSPRIKKDIESFYRILRTQKSPSMGHILDSNSSANGHKIIDKNQEIRKRNG